MCRDFEALRDKLEERFLYLTNTMVEANNLLRLLHEQEERERVTLCFLETDTLDLDRQRLLPQIARRSGPFAGLKIGTRFIFCLSESLDTLYDGGLMDENLYLLTSSSELAVPTVDLPVLRAWVSKMARCRALNCFRFDAFVAALAPSDLRSAVSAGSRLRREIALPQEMGGLGVPIASAQAPIRAAEQWSLRMLRRRARSTCALATSWLHALPGSRPLRAARSASAHLRRPSWSRLSHLPQARTLIEGNGGPLTSTPGGSVGASGASTHPPGTITSPSPTPDWDVQWRLNFGGVTDELRRRVDLPADGHGWRGKIMEHVVADAISTCVPPGVLRTVMQPPTERLPVDHAERCSAEGLDPSAARRADIAVEFRDLRRLVIDVATTNLVSDSALSHSVQSHMEGIESTKDRKYKAYYGSFHPLVISLVGGITERGWGVIKRICCVAAQLSRPRLPWEPYEWAVRVLRRSAPPLASRGPLPTMTSQTRSTRCRSGPSSRVPSESHRSRPSWRPACCAHSA